MVRAAVLAACVVCLSGCGTMLNLWSVADGNPDNDGGPYGGVAVSAKEGVEAAKDVVRPDKPDRAWNALSALWLLGVDTPLSAALDTVTLPVFALGCLVDGVPRRPEPEPAPRAESAAAEPRSSAASQ